MHLDNQENKDYSLNSQEQKNQKMNHLEDLQKNQSWAEAIPEAQGLYNPELEKDSCGEFSLLFVGFLNISITVS